MTFPKLLGPDFVQGKILMGLKAILDISIFVLRNPTRHSLELAWRVLKVKPRFTMVTSKNLFSLYRLVRLAQKFNLPGDLVECGVWNGGSAALMGLACLGEPKHERTLWLFDSFQGLPPPGDKDGAKAHNSYFAGFCEGNIDQVKMAFKTLGVALTNVNILPGWFDATLPVAPVSTIAILHIDADWYESVKLVLDSFYDKVTPGGYVILDDYGMWDGCNQALADFVSERKIVDIVVRQVDRIGGYFQKPIQPCHTRG